MKKLFLILLFIISISTLFSQSSVENQKKYDYFRQRLRDDFVVVDPTNRQGTNIPATIRNQYGGWLSYGENTFRDCIAVYMMLLSTEYAKNKKYGLDNTLTLNELSYLLIAVERLDANAEKYFRADLDGIDTIGINFWTEIDEYKEPGDLNGFFLRNDVDGDYNETGGHPHRKYPRDSTRFVCNYDDFKLKYADYYEYKVGGNIFGASPFVHSKFAGVGVETNNRAVMSQDEAVWLFYGLSIVSKLVDDNKHFIDTEGASVTIREWCGKIGYRTLRALHHHEPYRLWQIKNPVDGELIKEGNGGITYIFSVGFEEATVYLLNLSGTLEANAGIAWIRYQQTTGILQNTYFLRLTAFMGAIGNSVINTDITPWHPKKEMPLTLGMIGGFISMKKYIKLMRKSQKDNNVLSFEYYPLFCSILQDKPIEDNWKHLNNYISYNQYKDSISMLLDVIPECGSYDFPDKQVFSDPYWIGSRITGGHPPRSMSFCEKHPHTGICSNMDYMILFNLYYSLLEDELPEDNSQLIANSNHPLNGIFSPNGSHSAPATYTANNFSNFNTIYSNGNVTLIATDFIELLPGFEVKAGGSFTAEIGSIYKPDCDLWNVDGSGPCPPVEEKYTTDINNNETEADLLKEAEIIENTCSTDSLIKYTVYPNPVVSDLELNFNIEVTNIQLIDFFGKTIFIEKTPNCHVVIDFSPYASGLYILIIETNNNIYKEKIIKN